MTVVTKRWALSLAVAAFAVAAEGAVGEALKKVGKVEQGSVIVVEPATAELGWAKRTSFSRSHSSAVDR